jgi:ubiquinone/menaquinone biosynthesis C-methylase UbiE
VKEGISQRLAVIEEVMGKLPPRASLLDFGCGAGDEVMEWRSSGFDAIGCDVQHYSDSDECKALYAQGALRSIQFDPYRIPFDDATFDIVVSNQVFEHVNDYPSAIQEIQRVLKPGGLSLHVFPPRWKPIEAHVYVPFAGVLQGPAWLRLWAQLGVRNEFQSGMSAEHVTQLNVEYLRDHTNYLSTSELRRQFERGFRTVRFVEDAYLRHSPSRRARSISKLVKLMPPLRNAYSLFRARVILAMQE